MLDALFGGVLMAGPHYNLNENTETVVIAVNVKDH